MIQQFYFWVYMQVKVKSLSCVRLFATPWTVAYQAPPSMGFSRQECWSGLPFPSPGDLPNPRIDIFKGNAYILADISVSPYSLHHYFHIWDKEKAVSIDKWMDKENMVHICKGILLSHKRNETGSSGDMWLDLEGVIQSETSQKEKNKYCIC